MGWRGSGERGQCSLKEHFVVLFPERSSTWSSPQRGCEPALGMFDFQVSVLMLEVYERFSRSFCFNQNKVIVNMQIESFTNCRSQSKINRAYIFGGKTNFEPTINTAWKVEGLMAAIKCVPAE